MQCVDLSIKSSINPPIPCQFLFSSVCLCHLFFSELSFISFSEEINSSLNQDHVHSCVLRESRAGEQRSRRIPIEI